MIASAIREHSKALREIARAINANTVQRKEADEFWSKASHRCDAVWAFLHKRGWMLLTSIPGILMMIGAITPKLGEGLGHALEAIYKASGH